jgi:tetratricopeptide (TPR) repeat protein
MPNDETNAKLDTLLALLERRSGAFVATLATLEGELVLTDPDAPRFHPPDESMKLAAGTRLELRKGQASLRFLANGGGLVRLAEGASVELLPATAAARFRLLGGRVRAYGAGQSGSPWLFETPLGAVRVAPDCLAEASRERDGLVEVRSMRGEVAVTGESGVQSLIAEGRSLFLDPGQTEARVGPAGQTLDSSSGPFASASPREDRPMLASPWKNFSRIFGLRKNIGAGQRNRHDQSGFGDPLPGDNRGGAALPGSSGGKRPATSGATLMVNLMDQAPAEVFAQLIEKSLTPRTIDLYNIRNRFGAAKTNDILINDRSVGSEHGEIVFERDGLVRIRVFQNREPVRVNNEPINNQLLKDMDTVKIGDVLYTFRLVQFPPAEMFGIRRSAGQSPAVLKASLASMGLVVVAVAGVIFFSGPGGGGGAEAGFTPTPPPIATEEPFEIIEQMFMRKRYTEARDAINRMDQSDPQVAALKLTIDSTIESNDLLLKGKILEAGYAIQRIKGTYEPAKPVIELRDKINWERESKARESYQRAEMDFQAGRYDSSRKFYDEADQLKPGFEGASGGARVMSEAARLAKLANDALDRAAEYCRQEQFADAAKLVDSVRAEFRSAEDLEAVEKARTYQRQLNDYYSYATMMDFYQTGDAIQASSYFDKLSSEFIEQYNLAKRVEVMLQVGELVKKALQERSRDLAEQVLQKETNPRNAYHRQMSALKSELDKEKRDRAKKLLEWGEEYAAQEKYEDALKAFFESRKADEQFPDPTRRHGDMASILLRKTHQLPFSNEYIAEKRRVYNMIVDNSFPEDSVHVQASNLLKKLDG